MPHVEFTGPERRWYAREQQLARQEIINAEQAVQKARVQERITTGDVLAEIVKQRGLSMPPAVQPPASNALVVRDDKGASIGLVWGKEQQEFLDGKLVIAGAVVPPKPPAPPVVRNGQSKVMDKINGGKHRHRPVNRVASAEPEPEPTPETDSAPEPEPTSPDTAPEAPKG